MSKFKKFVVAALVAVGLVAGAAVVANAAAVKPDCVNLMYPLCARSVAAKQVVDNSIPKSKIVPADRDAFLKDTDSNGKLGAVQAFPTKAIEHLGGKYFDGFTTIGQFEVPAGTWEVHTSVEFTRTEAGLAGSMPQVGLRIGQDKATNDWGVDVGTVGGVPISPAKGHDLFAYTSAPLIAENPVTIGVYGFGYNQDTSAAGSGEITASVKVWLTAA